MSWRDEVLFQVFEMCLDFSKNIILIAVEVSGLFCVHSFYDFSLYLLCFFYICCVCILPQNNYIENNQRQDWQDDIEKSVQSQHIDIDIPIIFSGKVYF